MTDQMNAAREDLAFLRAVAEDRGPLPRVIGEHFLVVGVLYGLNVLYAWAGKSGLVPWPSANDGLLGWLPAAALHIPYALVFSRRTRGFRPGPAMRTFAVAWFAMVLMTAAIVAAIYVARARTGLAFELLWPAIAVALYGGAWTVVSVTRRSVPDFIVGLGCFLTAIICAALIDRPEKFLALGIGILLFISGPGLAIMLKSKR